MQHLTSAQKQFLRQTITNGDALIADLEREAESPTGANLEQVMAGMYLAFGMSAPLPSAPNESDDDTHE